MGTNSEARKRQQAERAARNRVLVHEQNRRREVAQQALEAVYPHASYVEADALLDQLETLGARIEVER